MAAAKKSKTAAKKAAPAAAKKASPASKSPARKATAAKKTIAKKSPAPAARKAAPASPARKTAPKSPARGSQSPKKVVKRTVAAPPSPKRKVSASTSILKKAASTASSVASMRRRSSAERAEAISQEIKSTVPRDRKDYTAAAKKKKGGPRMKNTIAKTPTKRGGRKVAGTPSPRRARKEKPDTTRISKVTQVATSKEAGRAAIKEIKPISQRSFYGKSIGQFESREHGENVINLVPRTTTKKKRQRYI